MLLLGFGFCPEANYYTFDVIKDLNLFVRKFSLKVIHHKNDSNQSGINSLMQLSIVECRELRDLLLNEVDNISLPTSPPSSPTPLLEGADQMLNPLDSTDQDALDPLTPKTSDLREKSKIFPPALINKSALLFLK